MAERPWVPSCKEIRTLRHWLRAEHRHNHNPGHPATSRDRLSHKVPCMHAHPQISLCTCAVGLRRRTRHTADPQPGTMDAVNIPIAYGRGVEPQSLSPQAQLELLRISSEGCDVRAARSRTMVAGNLDGNIVGVHRTHTSREKCAGQMREICGKWPFCSPRPSRKGGDPDWLR